MYQTAKEPTMVPVPIYEYRDGDWQVGELKVPVLDVHELLAYIHEELKIQCPEEDVQQFWKHLSDNGVPLASNHPGNGTHIPFGLYGDECVLGDPRDKVTAIFLQLTQFKPRNVRLGHFLLCCLKDEIMIHKNLKTLSPILDHVVWGANVAFSGYYPRCNSKGLPLSPAKQRLAGKPLTADHRMWACVELRGDWKWHERVLRLHATPTSKECCFLCDARAEDGPLSYANLADDAPWRATLVSTPAFITKKLRPGLLSPLEF